MSESLNEAKRKVRLAVGRTWLRANVWWEEKSDMKPVLPGDVPPSAESLTTEWLTAVLCKQVRDARVQSVTLGAASKGSSDRRAFSVAYNDAGRDAGLPTQLFFKGAKGFGTRYILWSCGIKENEAGFYGKIRPELDINAPVPYYAKLDRTSLRLAIVMEDVIATKGAQFFDIDTLITRDLIEQQLDFLATLHGAYWNSSRLDSEFRWLFTPAEYNRKLMAGLGFKPLGLRGLQRSDAVLPQSLRGRDLEIWRAYVSSMDISSRGPLTYIHGDPHLRNYYRTSEGKVGLADWQVTMKGSWGYDFAYTMLTSLTIENRRSWEKELLAFYLDRLRVHGGVPPPFEPAWLAYRQQTLFTFWGWLVTLGFTSDEAAMQPDAVSLEVINRSGTAVEDLDSIKAQSL